MLNRVANTVTGLPPLVTRSLVVLLVFVLGGVAGWIGHGKLAGPPDVPTMNVFQDWHLLCPDMKDKTDSCEMSQDVIGNQQNRLARLVLLRDKDKALVLAVTVPLGVYLEPGLGLKIGSDDVRVFQYKTCGSEGCIAVIPVDQTLLTSLDKAQDAGVVVASPKDGKAVELPFSMKGYGQARHAFIDNEAKHKSWWKRLWS